MLLSELYTIVKICRDFVGWMDVEDAKLNADLEQVHEINIMEARKKIKELKAALNGAEAKE